MITEKDIIETKCAICGRPFKKLKKGKYVRARLLKNIHPSRRVTCSKECANKHNIVLRSEGSLRRTQKRRERKKREEMKMLKE